MECNARVVAEKGAMSPCTVLILACTIPVSWPSASPELCCGDVVVGRYILIGMFRRGVPGGLSSLLFMMLNLVRLSGIPHFLINMVFFLRAMVRKRGRKSGRGRRMEGSRKAGK